MTKTKKTFKSKSAKNPNISGMQYHIRLKKGDIPDSVLIPGDPQRVTKIASLWDSAKEVSYYREYHTMKGKVGSTQIASTSSGIGAPGLSIAVEELVNIGVKNFIRVGSCGSLQKNIQLGDVIITTGAVRLDGASKDFVIPEYPAVANHDIVSALIKAAQKLKVKYHLGITASTDTFYVGQGRPSRGNYLPSHKTNLFKDLQAANVLNFEMEASCLLTMASILGVRAGAICVVVADRVRNKFEMSEAFEKRVARVAIEAIKILKSK